MLLLTLLLSPGDALACEGPTHRTECHLEDLEEREEREERERDRDEVDVRLGFEGTALDDPSTRWYAELEGHRDSWFRAEARFTTDERWIGRLGGGVDIFGRSPLDLRLGLFVGHVGTWQSADHRHLAIGTDVALGTEIGRLSGEVRWVGGVRRGESGIWQETDISLAYRVLAGMRVHGHWLRMRGADGADAGVGLGLSYTF